MAEITIAAGSEYDGTYELDDRALNTREWRWVRLISGYTPLTYDEGNEARDPDLYIALTVIAMCRAGRIGRDQGPKVAEELAEWPWDGTIQIRAEEEPDPVPLESTPTLVGSSRSGWHENRLLSGQKTNGSGPSSPTSSENPDATRQPTTGSRSGTC